MMKRLLLATTALALGGQALAAGVPAKRPVMAPAPFSWTGCYVGGHAGAGWSRNEFSDPGHLIGGAPAQNFAPPGGSIPIEAGPKLLGGAQGGCDYQLASNWVFGAEGDFSWTSLNGQATDPFFAGKNGNPITLTSSTNQLATATARLGYAWDHYLLYGKGGAAWTHDSYSIQNLVSFGGPNCGAIGSACNPTGSETRLGWIAGFGFEWAFAQSWSALIEFDHYGMGSRSVSFFEPTALPSGITNLVDVKQGIEAVKFGINYRLGGGR
jgi:outer membrane immunogenic protein